MSAGIWPSESPAPHMHFVVFGEPMPKERPRVATMGRGKTPLARPRVYTPKATEDYEVLVRQAAVAARPSNWPMRCRYRVDLVIYRSIARGDRDNYDKIACDGINPRKAKHEGKGANRKLVRPAVPGVLWLDDGRAYEGSQKIVDVAPQDARLEVSVTALPVKCSRTSCPTQALFLDEDGRCPSCPVQLRGPRPRRA